MIGLKTIALRKKGEDERWWEKREGQGKRGRRTVLEEWKGGGEIGRQHCALLKD